jgi:two-component system, chemotaxis family, chemotaxis protein CheY
MIVDDSRAVRVLLRRMMTEAGFDRCLEAGDGVEALDGLARAGSPPDVMLVDWNMPNMSGLELIREVRARDALRDVPIVMVTTETELDQMVRALAAGASEYVMKPFTKDVILEKLELLGIRPLPNEPLPNELESR